MLRRQQNSGVMAARIWVDRKRSASANKTCGAINEDRCPPEGHASRMIDDADCRGLAGPAQLRYFGTILQ
jgi:hypothetical protein